jgi:tRNA-uridine 2-sulfurtransferase
MSSAMPRRVVVAMSGGVDSSVAAARLVDQGLFVVGVTLHLWDYAEGSADDHGRCCAPEDRYDAQRVADALGFPHYTFDRRDLFVREVVGPFVDAYVNGQTPSPCTLCNRSVKLAELFRLADALGADKVATGHYARVVRDNGRPRLAAGADAAKDQSYFLYASPVEWLDRLLFPLGDSTKQEVRAEARARGLAGASKGESQELCFIGTKPHAYSQFVEDHATGRIRPGPIVDENGTLVGEHQGIHRFTVGQRRGLPVASQGRRLFVTRIDPATASVHVGPDDALDGTSAEVVDLCLAAGVSLPLRARVRIRYRHEGDLATVVGSPLGARVMFDNPVRAVTSGQAAVFYDGDRVLGGGTIAAGPATTTAASC